MKKTLLKKKSPQKVSVLKRKLWTVFSEYVRKRDKGICFTCGRHAEGSGYHAGHFISKAVGGIALYFEESNVRGQCYNCNINLGGNQWEYGQKLGTEEVARLYRLKQIVHKWTEQDYLDRIELYKEKIKDLPTVE